MTPVNIETAFPLSPLQQGILFHALEAPGSGMYVLQTRTTWRGAMDVGAFFRTWMAVVQRHQALRAAFVWDGVDEPMQVIGRQVRVPCAYHDWCGVPAPVVQRRLEVWMDRDGRMGFVLSRAPLMRVLVVRTAEEQYEVVWTCHHIIVDGWSRAIILDEVSRGYVACAAGRPVRLPRPPSYSLYLWRLPRDLGAAERFWRAQLGEFVAPSSLWSDTALPAPAAVRGEGRCDRALGRQQSIDVRGWCRRHAVSLATVLMGAWALVLSRYTRAPDVVFGITVSGRGAAVDGIERLVGMCMNTLPLRARVLGCARNATWLVALHRRCAEIREFEYTPLWKIQQWSGVARGSTLFDSLIVFENFPVDAAMGRRLGERSGVAITNVRGTDKTNYPILLVSSPAPDFPLSLAYDASRLPPESAERLLGHLAAALVGLTAETTVTLDQVSLLTDAEREQVVAIWNTAPPGGPEARLIVDEVAGRADSNPDAIAISADGIAVSYGALHARAKQLAAVLREAGVGHETPVAVCLPQGATLVESLLAVWLAGGAYVPVDPRVPRERMAYLIADVGARIAITDEALAEAGDGLWTNLRLVRVDRDVDRDRPGSAVPWTPPAGPGSLAYVIYTSGSTGQPKGVAVTHGNVGSLFAAGEAHFPFAPDDTWTWFHSAAFDFSVWEIWGALRSGARLVVVPYAIARSPEAFYELLRREQVTVLNQTPSAFSSLQSVDAANAGTELALRTVIFGGEALDPNGLRGWVTRHGTSRPALVNMYGITETTVHVTHHALTADEIEQVHGSRIGRGLPGWQTYVLDPAGQPAPVGVAGELYVGGAGLARGYVGRPELTAERFVPDPFSAMPGARLYRTGDRVRWQPDGCLDYRGRVDHQISLRGYRIEPGEIEAALRRQPGARDAVVLVREDEPGDRRLVAYVVRHEAVTSVNRTAVDSWHAQLRAVLPEHMVPSIIVTLDTLPLTPNGKLDRARLPPPDPRHVSLAARYAAPRTPAEAALAGIWAELLRVDRVGIQDNFFALGGDSMRVIQVQAKARERGLQVSIEQLMRHQTIERLACHVNAAAPPAAALTQPFALVSAVDRSRVPPDVEDAYPLTELQTAMLFHSELDPDGPVYHDVESFQLRMPCDVAALRAALADLMAAHPILRTTVHMTGFSQPLQLVHRRSELPLWIHDVTSSPAEEQESGIAEWLRVERRRRFEWTASPLFRVHVHRRTSETVQCTLFCHHAILDGWSVATFLSELVTSYFARLGSIETPPTPAPQATFRDYVALEAEAAQSAGARDYWLRHIEDAVRTVVPRQTVRSPRDERRRLVSRAATLPDAVAAGLRQVARDAGVPLKSVVLAGHLRVLALAANEDEVMTGLVSHGRTGEAGADRVLGLFLTTMPFRCNASHGSWIDMVRRVFDIECAHTAHRHFPMAILRRVAHRHDLYDAAFNFVNFHVYRTIGGTGHLNVIDGHSVAETEIPLLVQCAVDDASGQIALRIDADETQFPGEHVARLLGYHERAYAACADAPHRPCLEASLLSAGEREQVTSAWTATSRPRRQSRTLPQLIGRQARRTPNALAVVGEDQRLTYGQLVAQGSRLAAVLRRAGVGPDACVGLCAPRSADAMTAVVAVLQAGGACVPLDPAYPDERLRMMIEDSAVRVVLTTRALAPRLTAHAETVLCLDDPNLLDRPAGRAGVCRALDPDHLACVIYTSGSTGRPKGIDLHHRGMTNLIAWHVARLGGGARTLQFASLGFDVSLLEMMATWCSGGTLYLVPEPIRADSLALAQYLHEHAIEQATLPVVMFQQIAEHAVARPHLLRSLRHVITTGEQLRLTTAIVELAGALPDCVFHNHYGPAEAHVWVTAHRLTGEPGSWPPQPPIGRAIDHTRTCVVDRRHAPVPAGTPGELCIGGTSLARGYHNRPDLTAERFVPDPLSPEPGSRCYRTGDVVRWSPSGELEFLGRRDHQVKIRGNRIELREVEAVLTRHAAVRSAFVVAHEYAAGDTRLVAYVTPSGQTPPAADTLREALARVLPDAMIPAAFVAVEAFPLTRNGKIDVGKLPAPEAHAAEPVPPELLPRTAVERFVAAVYVRLLQIERIGVHESFFARGGHSLLATQAIVRLREAFELDIPLRVLFEHPTVAGMVGALEMLEDPELLEDIAGTLLEVENLSDAEVRERLASTVAGAGA